MPISSEAVTGNYVPVPLPNQNYYRVEPQKSTTINLNRISKIPSAPSSSSNITGVKVGLLVGLLTLAVIASGVVSAAVLLTGSYAATTNSITSSNSTTSTTTTSGSSSNTSSSSACGTNTCTYSTSYSLTSSGYYGVEHVNINCAQTLSNITAFIYVQTMIGATYGNQYNTFWSNTVNQGYSNTSSQITYYWTIISGQTISSSGFPYYIKAQFQLQGTNQTVSNDIYTVITQSTCNGQLLTYSGHF